MHNPHRQDLCRMNIKRFSGFHLLQINTRNSRIFFIDKTIWHTCAKMIDNIAVRINRNFTEAAERTQVIKPSYMVVMLVCYQHRIYPFKRRYPKHLFPEIRPTINQNHRIIGMYQRRRTQTVVSGICRSTNRACTPYFRNSRRSSTA